MSTVSHRKRTAAPASAAALAGSAVLVTAPAARAEVVEVNYACETPIGDRNATSPVRIDARADSGSTTSPSASGSP
ncbi:hypothetical protein SUDANB105_04431 [Streptomyces sp. enrichment culture]|uniref:hypothetical protein n=1 Tax=Streptomyces sp. enrichment culture TaxID=1795815 RepID=UPI003F569A12